MTDHREAVLLCAEDDDLGLVSLVHAGRQRGLALEVMPGVEDSDGPMLQALEDTPQALLVLIRSDNLSADRARALKDTFRLARTDEQDLLAVRFDPQRAEECLEMIARKLTQLDGGVVACDWATNQLPVVRAPINAEADEIDIDLEDSSTMTVAISPEQFAEFDVTVRHSLVPTQETAPNPIATRVELEDDDAVAPPRGRTGAVLAGVLAVCGLGAAGGFFFVFGAAPEAPTEPAVATPVEVIEAPAPEPAPDEPWPPNDATPKIAPTPLADAIEAEPEAIVVKPKKRRGRR